MDIKVRNVLKIFKMINRNDYIKNIQKDQWKYKMLNLDDIVSNKKEQGQVGHLEC